MADGKRTCGTSHGGGVAAEALECAHSFLRLLSLGQSTQKIYILDTAGLPSANFGFLKNLSFELLDLYLIHITYVSQKCK